MSSQHEVNATLKIVDPDTKPETTTPGEFYKLEYERAAQRYNEIYTDIWRNFSYMALVAGGILTFGSNIQILKDKPEIMGLLAAAPLFFWYMASYLPMNRYGDQVHDRLKEIEAIVEEKFGADLRHFRGFKHSGTKEKFYKHFTGPTVRFVVVSSFILLGIISVYRVGRALLVNTEPDLEVTNLLQPAKLAARIKNDTDLLSQYIRSQSSRHTKALLDKYRVGDQPSDVLTQALTNDLNRLILGDRLSHVANFDGVTTTKETEALDAKANLDPDETAYLNRLLLADAFAGQISPFSTVRYTWETVIPIIFMAVLLIWGAWLGLRQLWAKEPGPIFKIDLDKEDNLLSSTDVVGLKEILKQRTGQDQKIPVVSADVSAVEFAVLEKEVRDGKGLIVVAKGKKNGNVFVLRKEALDGVVDALAAQWKAKQPA